jgi:DNA polymerase-3 subunit alpha
VKADGQVKRLVDLAMQAGRPAAPQLHPRRGRGDRRPAALELVPLYRDPRSDMPVTQFDMKYVEGAGW